METVETPLDLPLRRKMSQAHTGSRVACYVGGVLSSRRMMSHACSHWVQSCMHSRRCPREQKKAPELHAMQELPKEDVPCSHWQGCMHA